LLFKFNLYRYNVPLEEDGDGPTGIGGGGEDYKEENGQEMGNAV
jgi:hypothetical protein